MKMWENIVEKTGVYLYRKEVNMKKGGSVALIMSLLRNICLSVL